MLLGKFRQVHIHEETWLMFVQFNPNTVYQNLKHLLDIA